MSENREPSVSIRIAQRKGRKVLVELFDAVLWNDKKDVPPRIKLENRFRIRVNKKWFSPDPEGGRYQFMTIWQFRDKFFQSLKKMTE
jgi:hypothetical protein